MVQAYIYILSATPFIKGVAKILETIIQKDFTVHFICENKATMKQLDASLWTYSSLAFLPHATEDDPQLDQQKILLTTNLINLNNANVLVANHLFANVSVANDSAINRLVASINQYKRLVSIYDINTETNIIQSHIDQLKAKKFEVVVFEEIGKTWKSVNV